MLSEEEKEAIKFFKNQLKDLQTYYTSMYYKVENLELVLNLIEKQNKIIDKMAEEIYNLGQKQDMRNDNITIWIDKEHILNYFTKLVKEEN